MGFALVHRLSLYGFHIIMGSRDPEKHTDQPYQIVPIIECLRRSSVIFIALHPEHYMHSLLFHFEHQSSVFDEKILIDLSNELPDHSHQDQASNAERLQIGISNAYVVKAFNTISSFAMRSTPAGESPHVFVASDHLEAKDKIDRKISYRKWKNS